MSKQSKFLPDSMSGALKSMFGKLAGIAVFLIAAWAVLALVIHNPYLNGIGAAGNFGAQSIMGNVVGALRYAVGFVPGLFILLCLARYGLMLVLGSREDSTPEYNILRGFVGVCLGAAGFGLIAPRTTYGGMIGSIAAADISGFIGGFGILVGILCISGFLIIAGILLHISLADVMRIVRIVWRMIRYVLTAFRLMKPVETDTEETEDEEEEVEEEEEEEE
ncbi:MAG: hypothetical protein J6S80_00780, partial [Alphaproteobacteria bacterium]|nr:hypothetical protein [Alphaproteobacteria bacterium]